MIKEPILREIFAYSEKGYLSALNASSGKQLALYDVLCRNASGSNIAMGILTRMANSHCKVYEYIDAAATLTDITDKLQAGTVEQIMAANNDLLYCGAGVKFGLVGFNCTIAEGAASVYTLKYYNGTSFVTLNNFEVIAAYATGKNHIVFAPPIDWAKGGIVSADSDKYYIEFKCTTAPATPATIDGVIFGKFHAYRSNIANHGTIQITVSDTLKPLILGSGEGVLPYFSTKHADNTVEISYNNY